MTVILLGCQWTGTPQAGAQTYTWTGGGPDANWGTGANWSGGNAPGTGTGVTLDFDGTTNLNPFDNYNPPDFQQFGNLLFLSTAGSFTLSGYSVKISGKIENQGANLQTVNLGSATGSTGGISLTGSAAELDPTGGDLTIGSPNVFLDGGALNVYGNNAHTLTLSGVVSDGASSAATVEVRATSNVIFGAANTYTGNTAIDAGSLTYKVAPGNATSKIFVGNGGTGTVPGDMNNTLYANTNASLLVTSGVTLANAITTNKADTGSAAGTGMRIIGTADKTTGEVDTFSGGLTLNGGATLVSSGSTLLSGAITVISGTIQDGTDTGNVSHALNINASGSSPYIYTHVTLSGNNTYSGGTTITGSSSLNINSATALGTGPFNFNSTNNRIDNTSGAPITLTNNNALNLNGTFNYLGAADSSHDLNFGTGAVTLNGTRFFDVFGAGTTLTFGGAIGEITAGSGFYFNYTSNNQGTLALTSTASTFTGNPVIYSGTVQVNSIGNSGSPGSLGKGSTIVFSGTSVNNSLRYVGSGESTNRTIEVNAGSSNPPGTATIDASGTGALVLNGAFLPDNTGFSKTLILQGTNTGTNAVQFAVTDPASGGGKFGLQKTGTGTWVLSGASTYTGLTTVNNGKLTIDSAGTTTARLANTSALVVNGGTLLLANSSGTASLDRINDAATVTLNGGTLNTGGLSEHGGAAGGPGVTPGVGALTLSSTSIIDLGNGASILAFADSHGATWSGTLKVYDWSGSSPGGNGTDQLFFGTNATGLATAQLAEIQFYSDAGTTPVGFANQILTDGEVVPVPETATWLGSLLTFGLMACSRFRRSSAQGSSQIV